MIQIVPNILVKKEKEFIGQMERLSAFDFVDIDIAKTPFTEESSLSLKNVLKILEGYKRKLVFHLMEESPEESLNMLIQSGLDIQKIFIHQESNIAFLNKFDTKSKNKLGISIKRESKLKNFDFYNQFVSIQLMTGSFGGQGKTFDEESLSKSIDLREMGFENEIGIDGGVNINSARIIKDYPIDRVSVGSFFVKSRNIELDKMKLDLALNMRSVE